MPDNAKTMDDEIQTSVLLLHIESEPAHAFSVLLDDGVALLSTFRVFIDIATILEEAVVS